MTDKYKNFDPDKLNIRKNNFSGYKYCPFCRNKLEGKNIDDHDRLACESEECDFIFYHNPIPAAGVVLVENNRVLLVKRAHPPKIGWWCIPAGFMEWHEHPSQTAVREVFEETGLEVRLTGLFEVYSGSDDPRNNAVLILYLAEKTGGVLSASDDADEVRFFDFEKLPQKIAFESHIQALKDYKQRFGS